MFSSPAGELQHPDSANLPKRNVHILLHLRRSSRIFQLDQALSALIDDSTKSLMEKEDYIKFRISKTKKQDWKKICKDRNLTLTDLLTASVENRILDNERRQILAFIEKQDNVFIKIETNINQVAKIANGQKFISESELKNFTAKLSEIAKLKKQQNQIFEKIYEMLAK